MVPTAYSSFLVLTVMPFASLGVFQGPWSQTAQNKDSFLLLFFTCRVMIIWKWAGLRTLGLDMLPAFNCFCHIWLISWNQIVWVPQMILALLLVRLSTLKKSAHHESCQLSFPWGKMRTAAWETTPQTALRNGSKETGGKDSIYVILVKGKYLQSSTGFSRKFLLFSWGFLLVTMNSRHCEGF